MNFVINRHCSYTRKSIHNTKTSQFHLIVRLLCSMTKEYGIVFDPIECRLFDTSENARYVTTLIFVNVFVYSMLGEMVHVIT